MRVYCDSSVLVKLYIREVETEMVVAFFDKSNQPILVNALQEFEIRNSIRQKVVRGDISESRAVVGLRLLDDDWIAGKVSRKRVAWNSVFAKAEELSCRLALKKSCRAIDLLHVAIALISGLKQFSTFDSGQAQVARAAGLKLIELSG